MEPRGHGTLGALAAMALCLLLARAEAQAPASGPTAVAAGSEATYVVKKGDTLWGIAKGLLNDPFLWPRIWERNPFIADPNRIYPGDTLALPGREAAPTAPVAEAPKPEAPKEAPKEEAKAPAAPEAEAPAAPPPPAPEALLPPLPPVPPASRMAIACAPILMDEAAMASAGIGNIVKSADDKLMLSQEDSVAVGLNGQQVPKVGERLAVIRPAQRVIHPVSKREMGRALSTLGLLEVTEVRDRTALARVIYGCEPMTVGDRVARFAPAPYPEDKIPQPATRQVEGIILGSPRSVQFLGLQSLVYVDVGEGQGIGPGDVFAIYRPELPRGNPATGQLVPIPPERLGEAVVIRVTDRAVTAVISASAKEIRVGDRAVLSRQIQP
jgi:LysM repeat protein